MSSFEQVLDAARGGEPQALETLFADHVGGLRAFVRLHADSWLRESSSDIVQSICREALADIAGLRGDSEAQFRQWLYTVARNKLLERFRFHRRQHRDVRRERTLPAAAADDTLQRAYATVCSPSRAAIGREDLARVESAFDRLPDDYKEVITLVRSIGLTHAEAASRLDRSVAATRKLLSRALAQLGLTLAGEG